MRIFVKMFWPLTWMEVKILAMAPSARRKTVIAESCKPRFQRLFLFYSMQFSTWPVCPFFMLVTIWMILPAGNTKLKRRKGMMQCSESPRRIMGMLAAWPYQSMEEGVMRGFNSAQATPYKSVDNWIGWQNNHQDQDTSIECAEEEGTGLALGESYDQDHNGWSLGCQEDRLPIGTARYRCQSYAKD